MAENKQHKKRSWTKEEDKMLTDYINVHGKGQWNHIAKKTGQEFFLSCNFFSCYSFAV